MASRWIFAGIVFLLFAPAFPGQFEKIAYIDPYTVLSEQDDTSGLGPDSYYDQLYSLGITKVVGPADSTSTNNQYGVGIMGSDDKIIVAETRDFDYLVHIAHNIYMHPETEQPLEGYSWLYNQGEKWPEAEPEGWICRPNIDDTGLALRAGTSFKYSRDHIYPTFKMMVWDTSIADTICKIHFLFNVELEDDSSGWSGKDFFFTGQDFDVPGEWKIFENLGSFAATRNNPSIYMYVYWYGQDSLAFDQFDLTDVWGNILETVTAQEAQDAFEDYYDRINPANHARFYPSDEPYASQLWGLNFYDDQAQEVPPYHRVVAAVPHWQKESYIYKIDPEEIIIYRYPLGPHHLSETTDSDSSVQNAYEDLINFLDGNGEYIRDKGLPYWVIAQSGLIQCRDTTHDTISYDPPVVDTIIVTITNNRDVTDEELETMIYLTVAYGASGVGYFTYATLYFYEENFTPPNMDISIHKAIPPGIPDSSVYVRGLVDWDEIQSRYVQSTRWYAAQNAHKVIDSLWPILEGNWKEAGNWLDIQSLSGGDIDSLESQEFHSDSVYIEVARFEYENDNYYMFINRRSEGGGGQHAKLHLGDLGTMEFYEPYTDSTWLIFDSCGVAEFTFFLDPGEMRLLRINQKQWHGEVSGSWASYSTNYISGDLIIDYGDTLTLNSPINVTPFHKCDETSGGADPDAAEIIVKGHLHAVGLQSDSISFISTVDSTNSWYGIRIIDSGSADIEYAIIDNAYIGYKNTSSDTLEVDEFNNTTISDFYAYGAWIENKNMDICNLAFKSDNHPATGLYLKNINPNVSDCTFDSVKYSVYIDQGAPTIEDFDIYWGNRAFWVKSGQVSDTTRLISCSIKEQSNTGVLIGQNNTLVSIDTCVFEYIGSYGLLNLYTDAYCNARYNLFNHANDTNTVYVYTNGGNTDLGGGATSSPGRNRFPFPDSIGYPSSGYIVYNSSSNTTYARFCCWGTYDWQDTYWWDYLYRYDSVKTIDIFRANYGGICEFFDPKGRVADADVAECLPIEFDISQNFPNPFNPVTRVDYSLPEPCHVQIRIYNVLGQIVTTLVDEHHEPGLYDVIWDGKDTAGRMVASGMYFYQMIAGEFVSAKKMIVLK